MIRIPFTKMVGTGNDFLVVDVRRAPTILNRLPWPSVSRAMCDRRRGIGADGLLVLEPSQSADVRMRVFNPDGSEAEMCGNGARCVARYLSSRGDDTRHVPGDAQVTIETKAGQLSAAVCEERVALRMTDPTQLQLGLSVPVDGRRVRLGFVNTGVPHAVVPVRAIGTVDVEGLGRRLRAHRYFAPHGANVNFIQLDPRTKHLRVRTYERGVEGETLACGTGLTASAVVYALGRGTARRARTFRMGVEAKSGDRLTVSFHVIHNGTGARVSDVVLEGSARRICEGVVSWPMEGVR